MLEGPSDESVHSARKVPPSLCLLIDAPRSPDLVITWYLPHVGLGALPVPLNHPREGIVNQTKFFLIS